MILEVILTFPHCFNFPGFHIDYFFFFSKFSDNSPHHFCLNKRSD